MEEEDISYKTYLEREGKSPATIASYMLDVSQFRSWLEAKGLEDIRDLTRFHVIRYKEEIRGKWKVNTYNTKINSLVHYNKYLKEAGYLTEQVFLRDKDRIKLAKGSQGQVEVFTEEEVDKLLYYAYGQEISKRDKLMILTLLYTGLRVSELAQVRLEDLDLLTRNLKVIGKGGKYREVPLKNELVEALEDYMKTERKDNKYRDSPYLLLSERSPQVHRDTILGRISSIGEKLGLKAYPHKFRHTFCTNLIRKQVPLATVANLAGHANIQTTLDHYINTSQAEKEEAIDKL